MACWLTGLASQGITDMELIYKIMQIRSGGLLVYWISKPRNSAMVLNTDQLAGWLTGLANQGITAVVLMQIRGLAAGWLTGLANQGITAMVLMQIRGWLAYWISKPRNYSNGANADQVADWLTGLANQEIIAMVLMQTRSGGLLVYWISKPRNYSNGTNADQVAGWLTGLANQEIIAMGAGWLTGLANQGITTMVLMQIRGLSQFDEEQVCAVTVQEFWETLAYLCSYFDSFPSSDPYPILVLPFDQVLINLRDIDLEKSGVMKSQVQALQPMVGKDPSLLQHIPDFHIEQYATAILMINSEQDAVMQ
ncbi:hypothetical protein VNO77_33621 [Canavalia gladiata]|uniref:Uncharacterized protein n=1 Tax=Canavalia gladiata TaxID=3824 RepID=A0AAN9KDN8_CANGL